MSEHVLPPLLTEDGPTLDEQIRYWEYVMGWRELPQIQNYPSHVFDRAIVASLQRLRALASRKPREGVTLDWSLARRILEQGMAIQQDYVAGKYPTYEHLSARLDEAARERAYPADVPSAGACETCGSDIPGGCPDCTGRVAASEKP